MLRRRSVSAEMGISGFRHRLPNVSCIEDKYSAAGLIRQGGRGKEEGKRFGSLSRLHLDLCRLIDN